jgi:LacI family transcriptional regulator
MTDTEAEHKKPTSSREFVVLLQRDLGELSKAGRRLAKFIIAHPGDTAILSSAEIAERCGVHASSVVRLAQTLGLSGYRELQSLFQQDISSGSGSSVSLQVRRPGPRTVRRDLKMQLLGESGQSFNEAARTAAERYCQQNLGVQIVSDFHLPYALDPQDYAARIDEAAEGSDGLLLVAREHPAINGAVRSTVARGVPVICLTSDLPSSVRTAYVGSDQFASGATAGWLCGRMLPSVKPGRVLFVYSVPFRCQLDREQGFRQVLRSEFPHLSVDERVGSNESVDVIYEAVRRYISKFGPPAAIYNVSGANSGIGRALEDEGAAAETIFIGHELNRNSRALLERGVMDIAIGHDFDLEFSKAVELVAAALKGHQVTNHLVQSQLFTRYNCAIL